MHLPFPLHSHGWNRIAQIIVIVSSYYLFFLPFLFSPLLPSVQAQNPWLEQDGLPVIATEVDRAGRGDNYSADQFAAPGDVTISGELREWHPITLTFDGPASSETASTNPFSDYALNVTFIKGDRSFTVPGYYAADGDAAETSAESGNKWRVHFTPDRYYAWKYVVSFKKGKDVAVNGGGTSAGFMDGATGRFNVKPSDKTGRDNRAKGRLEYVGEHYLRYAETGEWFVKAGSDAPENTLAYEDFDAVPNEGGRRKSWQPHARDYDPAEAEAYTWQNGKGSELLGAVAYLANKGVNAFSFLTFNILGDDRNVFPHLLKVSPSDYGGSDAWRNDVYQDRFDVSRLAQWERIFSYADTKGMYLHFKTQETENDGLMDGGNVGRQRKLYYRELIARFSHHLALNWNMGEENTQTTAQQKAMARYFADTDPYNHLRVLHTYPGQYDRVYGPLLESAYTGLSIQTNNDNHVQVAGITQDWVERSAAAGKKWVVAVDEPGSAQIGTDRDPDDRKLIRHRVVWGNAMAGGGGTEFYYGYGTGCTDLTCEDHRTRDEKYTDAAIALKFFREIFQPYLPNVVNRDDLTGAADDYVLTNPGAAIAVYRPNGGSTSIDLPAGPAWSVSWYNPRTGRLGSASPLSNGRLDAPGNDDWVALLLPSDVDCVVGSTCNDGDACTVNDVLGPDCNCGGTPLGGGTNIALMPTADAYLEGGRVVDNDELRIEQGRRVTYLKFQVPAGTAGISAARLSLTVGSDSGAGTVSAYLGGHSDWTERNLAGNTPSQGALLGSRNESYSSGRTYTWSLTPAAIEDGAVTIILRHGSGNDVAMKSSENDDTADRPVLRLTTSGSGDCAVSAGKLQKTLPATRQRLDEAISVSPNPFYDVLTLRVPADLRHVVLHNATGARVRHYPVLTAGLRRLDLADLPSGIYLLSGETSGQPFSRRLIKR